ncbi:thiamine phosphate synthase [Desulfovibrio ferrophilus]|uniref:Thiamine-phosphate synthase n=1 Tax=Desulfovibrio ferrophilus TaxID=241368 RepID=A0A2Z6AZ78_9BACT|nr:thiamine phosphate synthase [Desulfovibrio ferrophilus]BBD08564.1 thiamine-phosphate synthase [Desulfovibrio ferrophilus]
MTQATVDYSVYLVTDTALCGSRGVPETARLAVKGGATVIQVRDKNASTSEFIALAKAVQTAITGTDAKLIINDNVEVARAIGADGIHIGQSDLPYHEARAIMGPEAIIGLSVETMEQVIQAEGWGVDYMGISPVFDTPTKTDTAAAWGLDGLALARHATSRPLVGIGGIGPDNAADVIRAGANGVAVVSAICAAQDPEAAARNLLDQVRAARV